ncbi:MAG: hypothetical protein Ct9H300mP1_24070 [Planctomycetaceae bacterium]|nr:MAG: hypothetical protein Ct9H300mP1_24070 [Planctomycetaceae bacterium]
MSWGRSSNSGWTDLGSPVSACSRAPYSGRHVLPETIEARVTFPEVVKLIEQQTDGRFVADDFMPFPCAHPNCHTLTYAYRSGGRWIPLMRLIEPASTVTPGQRDHLLTGPGRGS